MEAVAEESYGKEGCTIHASASSHAAHSQSPPAALDRVSRPDSGRTAVTKVGKSLRGILRHRSRWLEVEDDLLLRIGGKGVPRGRGGGTFLNPQDVACLPDGRFVVSDSSAQVVQVFAADGTFKSAFATPGW